MPARRRCWSPTACRFGGLPDCSFLLEAVAPSPPSHARLNTTVPQPAPFTTTLQKQRRHSRLALPCVTLASLAICQAKQNPRVEVSKLDPDSRESVPTCTSASVRHVLSVALDIAAEPHPSVESRALSHLVNLQQLDFVHIALLRSPAARHNVKSNARSTLWADETRHADTRNSPTQHSVAPSPHLQTAKLCSRDIRSSVRYAVTKTSSVAPTPPNLQNTAAASPSR